MDNRPALLEQLRAGASDLGMDLNLTQSEALIDYLGLLLRWNRTYNLTSIKDPYQCVVRHLLDSLPLVSRVKGDKIIDIGSGGGLPGIPLAISLPGLQFTLLDSNGKKCRFLTQVKGELKLGNVNVVHRRVEEETQIFDQVVTRAFASLGDIISWSSHLLSPNGTILAMKGCIEPEELQEIPLGFTHEVLPLDIPGLKGEQRHLITITRENSES